VAAILGCCGFCQRCVMALSSKCVIVEVCKNMERTLRELLWLLLLLSLSGY
jgi:hypothetical protein